MAANTSPLFIRRGLIQFSPVLTTGVTTKDGSTLTVAAHLLFVAPAAEGAYLDILHFQALGTNIATLLRLFITSSTSGDPSVAANNGPLGEWQFPATTISETAIMQPVDVPVMRFIPASYRVFGTLATTVAAGWKCTAFGGDLDSV